MGWLGLFIAFAGAFVAIWIPLAVESWKRPVLTIERGDDLDLDEVPSRRLVHLRVVSRPLGGLRGRWLLRNTATGCEVNLKFTSRSDGTTLPIRGRWSGKPEPLTLVATGYPSRLVVAYDGTKVPDTRLIDISPGAAGQTLGLAIKADGDTEAYAFASESYERLGDLRRPGWELRDTEYDVVVVASAGGLSATARFVLCNKGTSHAGLVLSEAIADDTW